jgi:uncharacterized protein involved in exopolysaccharide biosynthesis
MPETIENQSGQRDFSLQELVEFLWQRSRFIASFTIACTAVAAIAAWTLPKKYTAIAVMAPVTTTPGGGQLGALSSIASQFGGGLASLAGLASATDSKKWETIAVLQSEALTEDYIRSNNLLPVLYAKEWDANKNDWKQPNSRKTPTLWKANQYFKDNIRKITTDVRTGLVSISLTWTDPRTAAKWTNDLIRLTNDYLREKAIRESERHIAYLTEEATKTNVVEAKHAIYEVMESELNKSMLARGSEEYALRVLDPATAPEKASSPNKLAWLLGGFFGGLLLSITAVLVKRSWTTR